MHWLLVFLGGGLGSLARHAVNRLGVVLFGPTVPAGTLIVNVVGSLAMGLLVGALAAAPDGASHNLRLFLATGLLGGFTTFSAFSLDALALWQRGQGGAALLYVATSVTVALIAIAAGYAASRTLIGG